MSSFSCCCRVSIFSNPETEKQDYYSANRFIFSTKQVKTSVNVHMWSFWSNLQIIHCNTTERDGLNMKDYPVLYFMHYLHTLQWSQQLCWLPPQPWWGRFSVRRGTTWTTWESFTDSRLQKGGITFCCTKYSTCQLHQGKPMNKAGKWKWLGNRNSSGMVHTWSFLPLIVKLLMAHAASFCVPKSPCLENTLKIKHCLLHIACLLLVSRLSYNEC